MSSVPNNDRGPFLKEPVVWPGLVLVVGLSIGLAKNVRLDGPNAGEKNPASAPHFAEKFDGDGDGRVSQAEFTGPEQRFVELDRNRDGYIDRNELPGRRNTKGQAKRGDTPFIEFFDTDGDGRVAATEFTGATHRFVELDVNQDGYVDRTEVSGTGAADRGRSR